MGTFYYSGEEGTELLIQGYRFPRHRLVYLFFVKKKKSKILDDLQGGMPMGGNFSVAHFRHKSQDQYRVEIEVV